MAIVKILDDVTAWAKDNICSKIQLKVPPKNTEPIDADYAYKTANPVAFTMFVPTEDRLPANIPAAFPSLCVRFLEGEDDMVKDKGTIGIQLLLSVWNPGNHTADRFVVRKNDVFQRDRGTTEKQFERNGEGWRDLWNFADLAVQAIEETTSIAGYEVDRSVPVKFGPLSEQDAVPDYYPFWFAWVTFQLSYSLRRNVADIQEFL